MIRTLLLDLDDTLLINKNEEFLPKYLERFSNEVAGIIKPDLFIRGLMAGTEAMVKNRQPDRTLQETFYSVFYPLIGVQPGKFNSIADNFYQNEFPKLSYLTEPIPAAENLVDQALQQGYRLAITTNPLFPLKAVLHRLDWARLSDKVRSFELITTYETFHFAKPSPEYLVEVLGRLGWPDQVIVVGDDEKRDILPGQTLGIPTYRVVHDASHAPTVLSTRDAAGTIEKLLPWVQSRTTDDLQIKFERSEVYATIFRATPAVLDGWIRKVPVELWNVRTENDEWSLTEILCHLRDVDMEVNLPRIQRVTQENNPFISGADTDRWADERQYYLQDGAKALGQFIAARMQLLQTLESLAPEDWDKPARHAIFGPTSLKEMVGISMAHDRLHLQQAHQWVRIICKQV